ncbi:N5-glutamine methyltransferase family protein [Ramlibacter algicola]|uniref:Class I SAM-dependent methyltransferase n=1 Tax=Ramlibacter algicola TaxID=2795217 RepID=A0A934Q010_9BURK|nr:class I SAM-dependent methyltransferase [Ramlibacter algicola]MBK0393725.1 class I SAM-dependent methyltransferase [Ramlibacter algicola]
MTSPDATVVQWQERGEARQARWRSESGWPAPKQVQLADDQLTADTAYRAACEGTALLWRGDFQNARQLLQALGRRLDRSSRKRPDAAASPADLFYRYRQEQGRRARVLGLLVVEVQGDHVIDLRRAPDLRVACTEAWGPPDGQPCVVALRELIGLVGAHEWRKNGVEVPVLGARIHPHYGVFSPVRGEYLDLVAKAPLPADKSLSWDIGTGTGVIAALLAKRGIERVVATDLSPRALACARDNIGRLHLQDRVEIVEADLFPQGTAPLIVCNPPWLPGKPSSLLDQAIFDPASRMLRSFLAGLRLHLAPGGEGWLVLSDLAEHLGLRTREDLLGWIAAGGLVVRERLDVRPRHPKAGDPTDPLAQARSREVTSLWRLAPG